MLPSQKRPHGHPHNTATMVEKKQIVYDLRLHYNGPLVIEEFYKEVEQWMREHALHKELKRKEEIIHKDGKQIEWRIEAWKTFDDLHKEVVVLTVLFNDVKEKKILRKGHTLRFQYGDVLVTLDGWMETTFEGRWTENPLYMILRTLWDKFVWMFLDPHDGKVSDDCYDLHKRLKAFLELYKIRMA